MSSKIPESTPEQTRIWNAHLKVDRMGADTRVLECQKCGGWPHKNQADEVRMWLMISDYTGPREAKCDRCGARMPWMDRRNYDGKVNHNKRHENLDWSLKNQRKPLWQIP